MGYSDVELSTGIRRRTISGSDCLYGTTIQGGVGVELYNFGAYQYHVLVRQNTNPSAYVAKINSSCVPKGNCVGLQFVFKVYGTGSLTVNNVMTGSFYCIASGNVGWVAGTGLAAPQSGSTCFRNHTYPNVNWAGQTGCSKEGTDFLSGSCKVTIIEKAWYSASLDPSWVKYWNMYGNAGIMLTASYSSSSINSTATFRNVNYAAAPADQPRFIIDYIPPIKGKLYF